MWRRIEKVRKSVRHAPGRRDYRDEALVLEPGPGEERVAVLQPAAPPMATRDSHAKAEPHAKTEEGAGSESFGKGLQ